MKVGLSTKEKAKKYVKSRRIGIIDHIACVPRVISLRKGRIADWLASIFPGLLGLFQLALSRLTRRVEEVKTLIVHQFQEESKKAQGVRLSVLFPEMTEVYSSAAESIMSYDLEISRETDAESLREWRELRHSFLLLEDAAS